MFDAHTLWLSLHYGREYAMPRPLPSPTKRSKRRPVLRISIGPIHLFFTLGAPLHFVSDRPAG